jgi:hypothetical protein
VGPPVGGAQPFFIALTICPPTPSIVPLESFYLILFAFKNKTLPGKGVSFRAIMIPFRERKNLPGNQEPLQQIRKDSSNSKSPEGICVFFREFLNPNRKPGFLLGIRNS